jgi:hypothetical protein
MLKSARGASLSLRVASNPPRKIFPDRSVRNISFDLGAAVSKDSPPDGKREIKD